MNKIVVNEELNGKRLDETLVALNVVSSRSKSSSLIKDGKVFVNGKIVKAHYWLKINDVIEYEEYVEPVTQIEGEDIPLDIIYEDDDVLIINKPAGLVVHPGNGNETGTLVNALIYKETVLANKEDTVRPGLVHRIDKDTSGLLAIAKSEKAFASLSKQLETHSMHREYLALVKGLILEDDGKIDAPIGRDPARPTRNMIDVKKGKESVTYFHVEKRFKNSDMTLVSCRLLTGRTHQIRVHMEYIGHPVIGDPIYGEGNRKIYKDGQLLHAFRLTFTHPSTNKEISFEAPLPENFKKILEELN